MRKTGCGYTVMIYGHGCEYTCMLMVSCSYDMLAYAFAYKHAYKHNNKHALSLMRMLMLTYAKNYSVK